MLVSSIYSSIFRECTYVYSLNDQERSYLGIHDVWGGFREGNELIPRQWKPFLAGTPFPTS